MKALLDEQLSPALAAALRADGFDVVAVGERPDLIGSSDRDVLTAATDEDRAVVTNNVKDFRPLAAGLLGSGGTHGGLILLPSARTRTKNALPALAAAIAGVMRDNPAGIAGGEFWIGPFPQA